MRKFATVKKEFKKYNDNEVKMPVRATINSVCYDFYSPIDEVVNPGETKLIFTNVKAYFNEDEGLFLATTSGMGKKGIILAQGIGVVECDYADNVSNDGNIGFMLHNTSSVSYIIKTGDKIGQGFFTKVYTCDEEIKPTAVRKGGFGSTLKN